MSFDREENQRQIENAKEVLERNIPNDTTQGSIKHLTETLASGFLLIEARLASMEETAKDCQRELSEGLAIIGGEV